MFASDMFEFYFLQNLLHQEMEDCLRQCAEHLGLSLVELQVLWIASASDTTTIAEIARITTYAKEPLEEIVMGLQQDNLVEEVSSSKSLCRFIQVTAKGTRLISQLSDRPNRCKCPLCADISNIQDYIDKARELIVKLRGEGSCDLITERVCRGR